MKKLFSILAIVSAMALPVAYVASGGTAASGITTKTQVDRFETAVAIIKKYETIHQPKHWPFVGYGHKVLPGEKFSRKKALSESEADALLRKDLKKLCAHFRKYGKDSLLLATLAYNIGQGAVGRSSLIAKLKKGDRDIREIYVAHCRYKGKVHAQIKRRRIEEFEKLYLTGSTARHYVVPSYQLPVAMAAKAIGILPKRSGIKTDET